MTKEDITTREERKKKLGRPVLYDPAVCDLVDAMQGSNTILEIGVALGVNRDTVYDWMSKYKAFSDAITRARERADDGMVSALYETGKVEGDVKAQTFWLKNRQPQDWKEKVEHEVSGQAPVFVFNIGGKREELGAGPKQVEGEVVDVEAEEVDE